MIKLYTEEQLYEACQKVVEKIIAAPIDKNIIIEECNYYICSKIQINNSIVFQLLFNNDKIENINVLIDNFKEIKD